MDGEEGGQRQWHQDIKHTFVATNGIQLHIAELGSGPVVLLLHGFPEIWYSWRYQMWALAAAGFRAVAPDFRGYGLTKNLDPAKNSFPDLVDDLIGLLDAIGEEKVYVVAKDFGAIVAYILSFLHPQRVKALVSLGIMFNRPAAYVSMMNRVPEGLYARRWAEPGRAEADFGRFDVATVIKRIYIMFSGSDLLIAPPDKEIMDLIDPAVPLPEWFTEEDLKERRQTFPRGRVYHSYACSVDLGEKRLYFPQFDCGAELADYENICSELGGIAD